MKKNILFFGALVGALLLVSCSGGNKKQAASSVASEELDNASKVINYYHTSLIVLRHVANAKDINAVLGYMEQTGKVPEVSPIAPPEVSARDTAELMDPGDYFNIEVRQNLKQSYRGLFSARTQFYDNFNKFLSYKQAKETAKIGKLLDENYRLSVEMSEYKQVIFDILSPLTEQAEKELLADEPLKDQIMAMRKMSGTVQSIMNLYSRKHALDGMRIDMKMAELKKELEAAKKLPAVTGYDEEQKNYYSFLTSVESFMKDERHADAQSRIRSGALTHSHGVEFVGRNVRLAQQFVDEHADLAGVVAPLVALAQRQQFAVLGDAHGTDVRSGLNSKY